MAVFTEGVLQVVPLLYCCTFGEKKNACDAKSDDVVGTFRVILCINHGRASLVDRVLDSLVHWVIMSQQPLQAAEDPFLQKRSNKQPVTLPLI